MLELKIYGSLTSPYVRKIRLLFFLIEQNSQEIETEFISWDIFGADREKLQKISPILKIPLIEVGGKFLYESRVVFNECIRRGWHPQLSWEEENILSVLDAAIDTLIQQLLLKRSQIILDEKSVLGRSHQERLQESLQLLENECLTGSFEKWNFLSMSLYSLVDWANFRELYNFTGYPAILGFLETYKTRIDVQKTDPRLSV